MGKIDFPKPVKLFIGLITNEIPLIEKIKGALIKRFGEIDMESELLDFYFTTYYNKELGDNLKRKILSFNKLVAMDDIGAVKKMTNKLEQKFSSKHKRRINIDPGYVSLSKVVLLTTKDYYHRIYLRKGIYAEVTLYYKDKTFQPLEWSYPDYRSKGYIEFFNGLRGLYSSKVRC